MGFYNRDFKGMLAGAINGVSSLPFPLTSEMFNVSNPRPLTVAAAGGINVEGYNTIATLEATGLLTVTGESYGKQVDVYYNRLDLSVLFKGIDLTWTTSATETQAFGPWLAEVYGIPMEATDIKNVQLGAVSSGGFIEIEAAADSPWFVGSCHVYYTKAPTGAATAVQSLSVSASSAAMPSVDINYTQSYNTDYSGNGDLLRFGEHPSSAADRQRLWAIIFGNRANEWVAGITGILYSGTESVQAAGGRMGFENLLIIPRLNAWVHFNN